MLAVKREDFEAQGQVSEPEIQKSFLAARTRGLTVRRTPPFELHQNDDVEAGPLTDVE